MAGLRPFATLVFLGLIFFTIRPAFCSPSGNPDFLIDVWTGQDGMPDSSVTAIAQTPDGYLWIGTYNGLARFDGVRFVNFDPFNTPALKHARVDGLFVDAQGTLWINTHDGSMTSFRNGVFTHEWLGGQVSAVFSSTNEIYFALLRGELVRRSGGPDAPGGWQSITLVGPTTGYSFRQDAAGTLWYNMRDGELGRITGANSELISGEIGLPGERVNNLASDDRGHIWAGTDKKIALWNGSCFEDRTPTNGEAELNTSFIFCTASNAAWVFANGEVRECVDRRWVAGVESWQDLAKATVASLGAYQDQNGGVWFRQFGHGLFYASPDGGTQRLSATNGLPGDRVSCWFQDREGNLWVGVDRGGLVRLRKKSFHVIGPAEGLSAPAVSSVCEDDSGGIWISTFDGGLNRWRNGALTPFQLSDGANRESFFSAYPDKQGRLWLSAGREDLFVLEKDRITQPVQPAELVHGIKAILVDRSGRVWLGRQNGLACWVDGISTNFGPGNGVGRTDIRALAEDRNGTIWIGGGNGVLYEFACGKFTAHQMQDKLGGQTICSLLPDADGTLWVGTFRGGLLRFKAGKFTRYTTEDGLPNDIIAQILDDGLGKLWIGSHKGIFSVSKASLTAFDQGKIKSVPCVTYGLYDGLPTLECSDNYQPSCWHGHDGTLWFATVKGLVSIQPAALTVNCRPPQVVIEEIFLDGKSVDSSELRVETKQGHLVSDSQPSTINSQRVTIPPGKHQFDFDYTALSFAAPDKVRFRYQLEGLDNAWVEADGKRSAHYGPLPPGEYRFQVTACNNDGIWNDTGAAISLIVLPHFWETWWFDVLMGVLLVASIIGAVRFVVTRKLRRKLEQLKQQRSIEHERERIARDIHDDLGAGLTQIMLQSALAKRAAQSETPAHLAQISETAHELVGAMDEIVWAIDPENDTLDGLVTYVGKFFQEFAAHAGLRCRLDLPAQPPAFVLSAEMRHNLFLAVKETLNNTVKHAAATEVSLQLKTQPSGFSFIIKDDGRGFVTGAIKPPAGDGSRSSFGRGLSNLAFRLEKIGGVCTITSEPGRGTEVELTVMLQSGGGFVREQQEHFLRKKIKPVDMTNSQ
jgi:signal transduction histidine kinase/ligand-binding sensor domain-containing protein